MFLPLTSTSRCRNGVGFAQPAVLFRTLIASLALLAAAVSPALRADDEEPPTHFKFQSGNIPRDLFPPEVLPPVRLTEEERLTIERARQDLKSDLPERRAGAVMLLGKYEHPSAREPVVEALGDPSARVRRAALVSVTEWNRGAPGEAVIPVLNLIGDEDADIRRNASAAVPTMMTIRRTYELIRPNSSTTQPLPAQTRAILIRAFSDEDAVVRRNMVNNAYALGVDLPPQLWLALLDDPDRQVRLSALPYAARHAPNQAFLQKAAEIAQREDRAERLQLARELSLRGANPENQELLRLLTDDADEEVAAEALLGRLRYQPNRALMKEAVARILQKQMGQEQAVRFFRLIRIAPDEAAPFLPSLITLNDAVLRREAVAAYLDFGLAANKPEAVKGFLEDPSPEVRQQAVNYLSSATGLANDALIEDMLFSEHLDVRRGLIRLSAQMPPQQASDLLLDLLLDENLQIRGHALREAVERQLPGWPKALGATLRDPDFELQKLALMLMFKYPYEGNREDMISFLKDYPNSPLSKLIRAQLGKMEESNKDT